MGRRKQTMSVSVVHPNAGGLDIGKDEIFVAVPPERDPEPVRAFATFTADLAALANDISGGRVLRSRTLPTKNRASQAFRMAAQSVIRADCALGAFYRRLRARIGPSQALVATAHKIARIVYHMLRDRRQYVDVGAETYSEQIKAQRVRHLQRQAARLGYTLQPQSAA